MHQYPIGHSPRVTFIFPLPPRWSSLPRPHPPPRPLPNFPASVSCSEAVPIGEGFRRDGGRYACERDEGPLTGEEMGGGGAAPESMSFQRSGGLGSGPQVLPFGRCRAVGNYFVAGTSANARFELWRQGAERAGTMKLVVKKKYPTADHATFVDALLRSTRRQPPPSSRHPGHPPAVAGVVVDHKLCDMTNLHWKVDADEVADRLHGQAPSQTIPEAVGRSPGRLTGGHSRPSRRGSQRRGQRSSSAPGPGSARPSSSGVRGGTP